MRRIQVVTAACAALMWTAAAGVPMAAAQGPGAGGGSAQGSTPGGSSSGATAGEGTIGDRDAQTGVTATETQQAPSGANDLKQFVEKAAIANMAEIELGKLATEQAQDPQVKQFAQMMVDEHTAALEQLRSAASSQGLQVAGSLDSKHQKLQQKLSKLQGAEFDRAYMDAMVDAHKDAEKLLKRRAENSGSASASNTGQNQGTSGTTGTSGTSGSDTSATTGTTGSTGGSRETGAPSAGTSGTTATTGTSGTPSSSAGSTAASGSSASMAAPTNADQWAAMTLPKVRAHLEQARSLEDQLKKSGKSNGNDGAGNTGAGDKGPAGTPGSTPPQQ